MKIAHEYRSHATVGLRDGEPFVEISFRSKRSVLFATVTLPADSLTHAEAIANAINRETTND